MTIRFRPTPYLSPLIFLAIACSDSPSEPPPPDPPVVTGVSATVVFPGDTLIITGKDFAENTGGNTITFTNPLAGTRPFQASATQLRVVVDADATSGPVTVRTEGGSAQTDSIEVRRGIGDVFVFGGLDGNYVLGLPNPTATTQYLLVPHATNNTSPYTQPHSYNIASESAPPVAALAGAPAVPRPSGGHIGPREAFEARRWEQARELVERYGAPRTPFDAPAPQDAAEAAVQATRQFYVLKTTCASQSSASSYERVTAQLRYSGTKCLVYADVDTLPTGNFSQSHLDLFGQTFDNSIEATNVAYFGGYSDVDGNDRVILLVTPVVNRLEEDCPPGPNCCTCGFIAGFFNPRDLFTPAQVGSGTTNHAEILYLLAADPGGFWDCSFPVDETAAENLGTITHEHEHLISASYRAFYQNGTWQETWLEEGMAHMAEDLNGDNSSNEARGKLYRDAPTAVSLEDNSAPLEQRGGIYLMLRLLVDRYGTDILKDIVQSKCTGRACITNTTGMGFYDAFAEFLAAQYLSGRGITADRRFNYTSIDLQGDFGPLNTSLHAAGGGDVAGTLFRTSGEFHIFTGVLNNESRFTFTNPGGQARLRHVVVRIQ